MTNTEAAMAIQSILDRFLKSRTPLDDEFAAELRDVLFDFALVPQLNGVAEIIAKAWLERTPTSETARRALIDVLVDVGKADEARQVGAGGEPGRIGDASDEEIRHHRLNLDRSGRLLGHLKRDDSEGE